MDVPLHLKVNQNSMLINVFKVTIENSNLKAQIATVCY